MLPQKRILANFAKIKLILTLNQNEKNRAMPSCICIKYVFLIDKYKYFKCKIFIYHCSILIYAVLVSIYLYNLIFLLILE